MIVIGSTALKHYGLVARPPSDVDLVIKYDEFKELHRHLSETNNLRFSCPVNRRRSRMAVKSSSVEFDVSFDVLPSEKILLEESQNWKSIRIKELGDFDVKLPPLEWLFAIKSAHIYCDINGFEKNISDYSVMKGELKIKGGFPLSENINRFVDIRRQEAETFHKHRTPKLDVTNDQFFEVSSMTVGYDFVHDDLHEVYKHLDVPIYQKMKYDQALAKCESSLFFKLTHEERVMCVLEEAYVIATERYLLKADISPRDAFMRALKRICTTLCSGFFREFAVDHYFEIMTSLDEKFPRKVVNAYNNDCITLLREPNEVSESMKLLRRNLAEN